MDPSHMHDPTLTTLRYWADPAFAASFGDDAADHEDAAYDGLVPALDAGLLVHNARTDTYSATPRGVAALAK